MMRRLLQRANPSSLRRNQVIPKRFFSNTNENILKSKNYFFMTTGSLVAGGVLLNALWNKAKAEEEEGGLDGLMADDASAKEMKSSKRESHKYVIVGGGIAGYSAVKEILESDPEAHVLVISAEDVPPYSRPPLTKELWKSDDPKVAENLRYKSFDGTEQSLWLEAEEDLKNNNRVKFLYKTKVMDIEPEKKLLLLDNDTVIEYGKCLIATGGDPRQLPNVSEDLADKVTTYRSLADYRQLEQISKDAQSIAVIGGGFLGSELACGLAIRHKDRLKVTQVYPETGLMGLVFPRYLSDFVTEKVKNELGVKMCSERSVKGLEKNGEKVVIHLDNGETVEADHVVVSIGIKPALDFASKANLETDPVNGGIVVNSELAARSDLYVAGDVASFYDSNLQRRRRVEHFDHAVRSGQHAGANMVGNRKAYNHMPFFWSDLGSIGYEAIGITDNKLRTVSVWEKPEGVSDETLQNKPQFNKGIIYYLNGDNRVVGAIFYNLYGKTSQAERVISNRLPYFEDSSFTNMISLADEHHDSEEKDH